MKGSAQISPRSAFALVIANMIGVGIFTTSGFALADLGSPLRVLAVWLCGGLLALAGALCYGAFARRLPESGGEYAFLSFAVHPLAGFLAGWVSLLGGFSAPIAAAGLGLAAYLSAVSSLDLHPQWVATAAIVAAALAHAARLRSGLRFQDAAVGVKIAGLVGFVCFGAWVILRAPAPESLVAVPWSAPSFALSLVWIWYAYSGWNAAVYVAAQVEDPVRNVPRVLVAATGSVTLLYLAINAVFLFSAPAEVLSGRADIAAVAAQQLGGDWLRGGVSLLVILALLTSISSMVMTGPRVYARMCEDGVFPQVFAAKDPDAEVPRRAVIFQALFSILIAWSGGLLEILGYVGFLLGLSAAATVAALLLVRAREGASRVPIPGDPWLPLIFVGAMIAMTTGLALRDPGGAGVALASIAAGLPFYYWMRQRKEVPMRKMLGSLVIVTMLVSAHARAQGGDIEELARAGAYEAITESKGVVFLDVFAEW